MSGEVAPAGKFSLGQITALAAVATTLITLAVSFNGFISSLTDKELALRKEFHSSFESEETYWTKLSDDYLSIYDNERPQSEEWRQRKIEALRSLANRPIPDFREFEALHFDVEPAKTRLLDMRTAFKQALDRNLPDQTVAEFRLADFQAVASQAATEVARQAPADKQLAVNKAQQIIFAGPESGWDLDFIWCTTPGDTAREGRNYSAALSAANSFAGFAKSGGNLMPGTPLGRIRLRTTSDASTAQPWRASGRWIIRDDGPGEIEAADAVRQLASSSDARDFPLAVNTGVPTPYYTSLFFCGK